MNKILIVGATSAIAQATAREWAKKGACLLLAARNTDRLNSMAEDLKVRGAREVFTSAFDAEKLETHEPLIKQAYEILGGLDIALLAHGSLGNQTEAQLDFKIALRELSINSTSYLSLLSHLANEMEHRSHGCIAVIGSVAGDRGRQSNYVYGTAKGSVAIFLQGLRQRLAKSNVHVLTIKPGFVDTPMTREFRKGLLWAQPGQIAQSIIAGIEKRKNVVYAPWFWRWIMIVIKSIPEGIFKKISL